MKRLITKLAVFLMAGSILFPGCTRDVPGVPSSDSEPPSSSQDSETSGISENSSQEGEPSAPGNGEVWQMEEEYLKIEPDASASFSSLYGLGVMPGHALLSSAESDMQTFRTAIDYDLKNGTWQEVGNLDDSSANYSAQETYLCIDNKIYFNRDDYIACIDITGQEVSKPASFDFVPISASMDALDDHSFVLHLFDSGISGGTASQSHIYLFDTAQNSYQEILTDFTGSGELMIISASALDGLVYLLGITTEDIYKIIVCSPEGEVQQEIILDDLQKRLKENDVSLADFVIAGDCFFFTIIGSGPKFLYAYEDGGLRLIDLPSDSVRLDNQRGDNLRDREQNPYYYFWDAKSKTLYPFNCQTKAFSKLSIGDGNDENLSIGIWDDADGNLLVSYYKQGQSTPDYYYIPQSTILKYME